MSQPPYGVPPQQPPAYGQAPPPAYLGGGAPGPVPSGPPGYGAPAGFGGPGLPPPPPSATRTIGLVMGLVTTFALIAIVVLVWLITANN